jgi:hypothetical protein
VGKENDAETPRPRGQLHAPQSHREGGTTTPAISTVTLAGIEMKLPQEAQVRFTLCASPGYLAIVVH